MSSRYLVLCLFSAIAVLGAASGGASALPSLTQEESAWLSEHPGRATLYYSDSFPPIEFARPPDGFVGMGADVIELVEKRLNVVFPKQPMSDWNRHLAALESGECAIAPTIVQTAERERYACFTTPYASVPVVIIGPRSLGSGLTLDVFKGKRVAVVSGYATEGYVKTRAQGRFDVVVVTDVAEGLQAVAFGKVDAFVGNLAVAAYYINDLGISNLLVVGLTDYSFDFRIGVSRKYPLLFSAIQKALDDISPEELAEVRERWISLQMARGPSSETIRLLKLTGLFLVLLIIGLTVITLVLKHRLSEKVVYLVRAQETLAESEARFRSLFENSPTPVVELTLDGTAVRVNEAFTRTFGYTIEDTPNLDVWRQKAFPEKGYRQEVARTWQEALAELRSDDGLTSVSRERKVICKDGTERTVILNIAAVGGGTMVTLVDLTDQKSIEAALAASLRRFETLFELAPFPCTITDMEGRYLMANRSACDSLGGRSADQVVGHTRSEMGVHVSADDQRQLAARLQETGSFVNQEVKLQHNGQEKWLLCSCQLIDLDGTQAILNATVDISERKRIEQALRDSEQSLRITLDSIGDAVIATDTASSITRMNPVAERLTGWSAADARGRSLGDVFRIVHALTRDPVDDPVPGVVETGEAVSSAGHSVLLAKDGNEYEIAHSGAPIRHESGELAGVVLVFRDVTEENALLSQLHQAQKLEAVGQLAGGIAHDFNNMLGGIMGAAGMVAMKTSDETLKRYNEMIIKSVERAADLTGKLLAFARKQETASSVIDVRDPLNDALSLLERTVDRRVVVRTELPDRPLPLVGSPTQLQNAFLNLLINAVHAMPDGGVVTVVARTVALDASQCDASSFELSPGTHVDVEIRDTGCGIEPALLSRVFDPFFTTKKYGEGTGLGLAAVHGTVLQHGGAITVQSEVGEGTCFHLLFPLVDSDASVESVDREELVRGTGAILLIDDEPVMRDTASGILKELGYQVIVAEDGRDGVEKFAQNADRIDLVILDMVMPEMNGRDCFDKIREIKPDAAIVISSGFSGEEELVVMKSLGLTGVIRKPFRAAALSQVVQDALQGRT